MFRKALWFVLCLAWLAPTAAARVRWEREVELRLGRDGNVAIVGEDRVADEVAGLTLRLGLVGESARRTWTLTYAGGHERFREQRTADNTSHALAFALSHRRSRRSAFEIGFEGARREQQGVRFEAPDDPTTLLPRTRIGTYAARIGGEHGRRNLVRWILHGRAQRYEDRPGVSFQDSDRLGLTLTFGRRLSRQAEIGATYSVEKILFEARPDATAHLLGLTGRRSWRAGWSFFGTIGAQRTVVEQGASRWDPAGEAGVTRSLGRAGTLSAGLRQRTGAGTGQGGASRDRGAYLAWSRAARGGRFGVRVALAYWRRDPLEAADGLRPKTFSSNEALFWNFHPGFGLGVFHQYADQTVPSLPQLDTAYHSGGILLRWQGTRR